jgi:hypothetical protein
LLAYFEKHCQKTAINSFHKYSRMLSFLTQNCLNMCELFAKFCVVKNILSLVRKEAETIEKQCSKLKRTLLTCSPFLTRSPQGISHFEKRFLLRIFAMVHAVKKIEGSPEKSQFPSRERKRNVVRLVFNNKSLELINKLRWGRNEFARPRLQIALSLQKRIPPLLPIQTCILRRLVLSTKQNSEQTWAPGGLTGGTDCTSQRVGENRHCQQDGKRDVLRDTHAGSVGFYPRARSTFSTPCIPSGAHPLPDPLTS